MEKKNKENKNSNNSNNKKKKYKTIKRFSLGFPFHINIKIISDNNLILNLLNQIQIENKFSQKLKTLYFGLNLCLNYIQRTDNSEKIIFIFYKKEMESLYDLILFRAKCNSNIHIYFLNENYQKNFIEQFKLKRLLGFILIKSSINEEVFNQINNLLESYDLNNNKNQIISNNNIQETMIEFKN